MVLYTVNKGVIEVQKVVRETKCGWRDLHGGFINRSSLGENQRINIDLVYHTTDAKEAVRWAKRIIGYMDSVIQVARASIYDVEDWIGSGVDEDAPPKSRIVELIRQTER